MPPRDLRHELNQDTPTYAPAWSPEPGDTLIGRLVRMSSRTTKYGPQNIAVVQSEDDGETYSVYLSSVLQSLFDEQDVCPGARLGIKYTGKHPKGYHLWSLVCEKEELPAARPQRTPPAPTRAQSRPYAEATMRGPAPRSAANSLVSMGPEDDGTFTDPFSDN